MTTTDEQQIGVSDPTRSKALAEELNDVRERLREIAKELPYYNTPGWIAENVRDLYDLEQRLWHLMLDNNIPTV